MKKIILVLVLILLLSAAFAFPIQKDSLVVFTNNPRCEMLIINFIEDRPTFRCVNESGVVR